MTNIFKLHHYIYYVIALGLCVTVVVVAVVYNNFTPVEGPVITDKVLEEKKASLLSVTSKDILVISKLFPAGLPIERKAQVIKGEEFLSADKESSSANWVYLSAKPEAEISKSYTKFFTEQKWQSGINGKVGEVYTLSASKAGQFFLLTIQKADRPGFAEMSTVSLSLTVPKK